MAQNASSVLTRILLSLALQATVQGSTLGALRLQSTGWPIGHRGFHRAEEATHRSWSGPCVGPPQSRETL